MTARVLITDDHPLVREGLAMAMRAAMPGAMIDFAGTIAQAESQAQSRTGYRLALLDLILPDTRGFTGLLRLQFAMPNVPIVLITACREPEFATIAKSLGAVGLLRKDNPLDELTAAFRRIVAGDHVFPEDGPVDLKTTSLQQRIATLSDAQRRVLFALADGRLNKQIAGELAVTEATIKAHVSAILRKLGVQNRMQAVLMMQPLLGAVPQEAA
jgi:DNA-binding NarL/FixJ family response regulator